MTTLDAAQHPLVEVLEMAFAQLIEAGLVDVVAVDDEAREIEVQSDDWTLHCEQWPLAIAWIALDEGPISEREQIAALEAALGPRDVSAMLDADARLGGGLLAALELSGDTLSQRLAASLGARGSDDDAAGAGDGIDPDGFDI